MKMKKLNKREALDELWSLDHAIIEVDFAKEIAAAFSVDNIESVIESADSIRAEIEGRGGWLDGDEPAVSAHLLAELIAEHLDPEFRSWQVGVGSRLRTACEVIKGKLKEEE